MPRVVRNLKCAASSIHCMPASNEYGIRDMMGLSHMPSNAFSEREPSGEKICRYRKNEKLVLECEVADHQINGEMPAQVSRHVAPSAVSIRHQFLATGTFFRAMPAFWMALGLALPTWRESPPPTTVQKFIPKSCSQRKRHAPWPDRSGGWRPRQRWRRIRRRRRARRSLLFPWFIAFLWSVNKKLKNGGTC